MKKLNLVFIFLFAIVSFAYSQRTVSGTIADEAGEALIGASVVAEGTTTGTVTDFDGKYSLNVPEGVNKIVVSYTGFATQTIELGVSDVVDVTMSEGLFLEAVTVNALGLVTNKDKTGSASSTVAGEVISGSGESGALQGLAGKTSSVVITRSGGDPGAGAYVQIRGQNTITGNTQPLFVIDGVPVFNSSFGAGRVNTGNQTGGVVQQSRLNDINPDDIESMEILKGAAAAAIWGTRAANGVVVITTKKGSAGQKKFDINVRSTVSLDQVNVEHPLQTTWGQGRAGNFVANVGESYGSKISDRPGGDDFVFDAPGTYFDVDGNDLYEGYFEAEDGTRHYAIAPANATVYDANGNEVFVADEHGGKLSNTVYQDANRDQVFRDGYFVDNSISIGGGDLNSNFFLSVSDLNQKGVIQGNSDYRRTTFRTNVGKRFNDMVKMNVNAFYSRSNSDRIQTGSNLNGLYLGYLRTSPDFDNQDYIGTYYDANGVPNFNRQRSYRRYLGNSAATYNNPGWTINEQVNTSEVDRYMFSPELSVDPTSWLNFTARVGLDNYVDNRVTYFPVWSAGGESSGSNFDELYRENQTNVDLFARMSRSLSSDISARLLVGYNYNDRRFRYLNGYIANFTIPDAPLTTIDNSASADSDPDNFHRNVRTNAGYAELGFDLYDQLTVTLTGRTEVASTFTEGIFYPSASLAWRFSQLGAMKGNSVLSFGKLRASYGTVGIQPLAYLTTTDFISGSTDESWGPNLNSSLYGGAFQRSSIQGNPDLVPERKTEIEFGVDLRFVKDRVGLSATYYTNEIDGAIFAVDVPASTGFASKWDNAATIENNGIELDLDADIIKTKDFNWNFFLNWSRNRNEVVDLQGVTSIFLNGFTGTSSRAVEGEPVGTFWGGKWARNDDGSLDLDENGFPQQALEEGVMGDPNPDWRGALGSALSWKGLSFSFLFETMQGNEMWGGTRGVLTHFGRHPSTANEVTAPSDIVTYGGSTIAAGETFRGEVVDFGGGNVALDQSWYTSLGGGFGPVGEQFIYDASWTRLREITLAYRFNSEKFQDASKLDFIELSVSGRNLWLSTEFEGQDPDMNLSGASNGRGLDYFSNPGTKSILFSIKLNY